MGRTEVEDDLKMGKMILLGITICFFIAIGGFIALVGLLILRPQFFFEESHLPVKLRQFLGLGHWKKS